MEGKSKTGTALKNQKNNECLKIAIYPQVMHILPGYLHSLKNQQNG